MKSAKEIKEQPSINTRPKLVYSTDKKVQVRNLGCRRCENLDWRF